MGSRTHDLAGAPLVIKLDDDVDTLQVLGDESRVSPETEEPFVRLLADYYDQRLQDEHKSKGGESVVLGYAGCALPLVLHHNCPNNSVYLLWADTDKPVVPLFPRVERHR